MKLLRKILEGVQILIVLSVAVFFFYAFLKILVEPLAPVVTVLAVLFFTLHTFNRWQTTIMSIGGLVLYVASWPAVSAWGVWPGMSVWMLGVLTWLTAVCMSFSSHLSMARRIMYNQ